ncbi:uncharacterized protein LOC126797362 [Argentina anserina]|uniref:uncharacterized protein LOC126797362 n=1 Tax=Argentina anserina TaxID=57926 RepID=UPI0021766396|nr:uncharacterized protein LOC126797362 [Potentilla anserina]
MAQSLITMHPAVKIMGPDLPIGYLKDPIVYFINPVSDSRVTLPSQLSVASPGNDRHDFFYKVVASSAPTEQQQRRCLVAAIAPGPKNSELVEVRRELVICTPYHKSWTKIRFAEKNHKFFFCDIEIIDRKLYATTKNLLMVFHIIEMDFEDGDGHYLCYKLVEKVTLHNDKRPVNWVYEYWGLDKERYMEIFEAGPYLVKDATSKELFVIFRDVSLLRSLPITYCTEGFRVLKLQENCDGNSSRLVEVSDLGDRIMFLSKFSNQLMISSCNGVSGSDDETSLKRNCIYFAFNWPGVKLPGGDFGEFSLTNKKVMPLTFPEDQYPAELFFGSTAWFNPYIHSD